MYPGHLAVTVKDMELSQKFYTQALGLEKAFAIARPETGEPWIEYLSVGGGQFVELFYGGETDNPWEDRLRGFNHICIGVEDIHRAAKQVEDAGFIMDVQPNVGCDGNWQAWLTDPDGVRVELMQIDPTSPHAAFLDKKS